MVYIYIIYIKTYIHIQKYLPHPLLVCWRIDRTPTPITFEKSGQGVGWARPSSE